MVNICASQPCGKWVVCLVLWVAGRRLLGGIGLSLFVFVCFVFGGFSGFFYFIFLIVSFYPILSSNPSLSVIFFFFNFLSFYAILSSNPSLSRCLVCFLSILSLVFSFESLFFFVLFIRFSFSRFSVFVLFSTHSFLPLSSSFFSSLS